MGPVNHLEEVVLDLERHSAEKGWDAAPSLYALVRSGALRQAEPGIADQLPTDLDALVPVEQDALPELHDLEKALTGIVWPETVDGCALVIERVILPADIEAEVPADPAEAEAFVGNHPAREDVRMVIGVLRDGARLSAIRMRSHDSDDAVLTGAELVRDLPEALAATFEPDEPGEPGDAAGG
ncbi:PPA1309 family protein [Actinomadura sp. 3N508]|uniref:PPA1309 family protein n=1 Tax=Actinomadura sp. 3N508 TaxID=3375153 RepID=UPI003791D901